MENGERIQRKKDLLESDNLIKDLNSIIRNVRT
jgi:hypothetical protein